MTKTIASLACGVVAAGLMATGASAHATLASVKQKGFLTCGASSGSIGFGMPDAQGNWTGFDVDFCRAIAAAIFDDPTKVRFIPLNAKDRFTALHSRCSPRPAASWCSSSRSPTRSATASSAISPAPAATRPGSQPLSRRLEVSGCSFSRRSIRR